MAQIRITFDKTMKEDILHLYNKTLDEEGFIVEKDKRTQRVLTSNGEEIHMNEWAGITKGSEEFVKSDAFSLLALSKKMKG